MGLCRTVLLSVAPALLAEAEELPWRIRQHKGRRPLTWGVSSGEFEVSLLMWQGALLEKSEHNRAEASWGA